MININLRVGKRDVYVRKAVSQPVPPHRKRAARKVKLKKPRGSLSSAHAAMVAAHKRYAAALDLYQAHLCYEAAVTAVADLEAV